MLGIVDLLGLRGFDAAARCKLVRHQDARYDVHDLVRRGWMDAYQARQARPIFDGIEFVISFVGLEGTRARLLGVYRVAGRRDGTAVPLPPDCPHSEWLNSPHFYDLIHVPGFEDLENRVVIDWGKGALAWHQQLRNKEVVEILPRGQLLAPFRDYLDFTLSHSELEYLFAHESANSEWRARLSAVAGIYLILATTTGAQYIGSAYGASGIWGRWACYARDGHGGNSKLRALLKANQAYPDGFRYSILQILPGSMARAEVLGFERRYKIKLGSRATGLNDN
jgi:hypothetical protein